LGNGNSFLKAKKTLNLVGARKWQRKRLITEKLDRKTQQRNRRWRKQAKAVLPIKT